MSVTEIESKRKGYIIDAINAAMSVSSARFVSQEHKSSCQIMCSLLYLMNETTNDDNTEIVRAQRRRRGPAV